MKKSDLKVGAFVLVGLVVFGVVVFMIGDERRFFDPADEYRIEFNNVQGLNRGAPVRMGGVRIGQVSSVSYGTKAGDPKVYVTVDLVRREAGRVRQDSVARIVNKGLLGDKMLDISKGESGDVVPPGGLIASEDPADFLQQVDNMANRANQTLEDVSSVAAELANEDLHTDIRESAHSINVMLKHITDGSGYPNRLLTDPAEAERISRVVSNLERTTLELSDTLTEVRLAVRGVRTGPGFAHDMLYGEGARKEVAQIGNAAEEVAVTLRSIREGDGFARDVLFGGNGDTRDALANVTQLTADLRDIVRGVKQGKGTVGALLVDPSIYEDLKRVLGNVERNSVLRALVRYSIRRDEPAPEVKVEAPAP